MRTIKLILAVIFTASSMVPAFAQLQPQTASQSASQASSFEPQLTPPVKFHNKSEQDKLSSTKPTVDKAPNGASAKCRDGTYSFSKNHRGTCSHHGGVANWL